MSDLSRSVPWHVEYLVLVAYFLGSQHSMGDVINIMQTTINVMQTTIKITQTPINIMQTTTSQKNHIT